MPTRPSVVRLFSIHEAIAEKTFPTSEQLAKLCEVNARTIKRDVKALRDDFGAPVEYSRERNGYYYTHDFNLTSLPLTEGELLAVCMTRSLVGNFNNTHFAPAIKRALFKLQLMLPETVQSGLDDDGPSISFLLDPAPPDRPETCIYFNDLLRAIDEHRQVRLTYYSMGNDEVTTRVIDPYHIFFRRGMWYLYAWCNLRNGIRDFALWRIRGVSLLSTTFSPPDLNEIRAQLAQRFSLIQDVLIEVAIWFDPDFARRIRERVWHTSQRIDDHPDGSCTLYMTVEGLKSVKRWVLGFGHHAKPLAPSELVDAVGKEALAIVKQLGLV